MLKLTSTSNPEDSYCLFRNSTVHVGRLSRSDIVVIDNCVSRLHCVLHVRSDGSVSVTDEKSSSGTFVKSNGMKNAAQIALKTTKDLEPGDLLSFGDPRKTWKLEKLPMLTVVIPERITGKKRSALTTKIQRMGGTISTSCVSNKTQDFYVCDTFLHFTEFFVPLSLGISVVSPEFFTVGLAAKEGGAGGAARWPKIAAFLPAPDPRLQLTDKSILLPKEERRSLFKGRTFFVTSGSVASDVKSLVEVSGGTAKSVTEITRRTNLNFNNVVLMEPPTRRPATIPEKALEKIREDKVRAIDAREVLKAILASSCEKYTNPNVEVPSEELDSLALNVGNPEAEQARAEAPPAVQHDSRADTCSYAPSQAVEKLPSATSDHRTPDGDEDLFAAGPSTRRSLVSLDGDEDLFARRSKSIDNRSYDGDADLFARSGASSKTPQATESTGELKRENSAAEEDLPATKKARLEERPPPKEVVTRIKRRLKGSDEHVATPVEASQEKRPKVEAEEKRDEPSPQTASSSGDLFRSAEERARMEVEGGTQELPSSVEETKSFSTTNVWLDTTLLLKPPTDETAERSAICLEMRDLAAVVAAEFIPVPMAQREPAEGKRFRKQLHYTAHPSELVGGSELVVFLAAGDKNSSIIPDTQADQDAVDHFREQDTMDEIRRENREGASKNTGANVRTGATFLSRFGRATNKTRFGGGDDEEESDSNKNAQSSRNAALFSKPADIAPRTIGGRPPTKRSRFD